MSEWVCVPDDYMDHLGFVYQITHIDTGCYYIGKKQFLKRIRRKPLKGRKRARICHVESDWKKYWGSSNALLAAVEKHGEDAFIRRVLSVHDNKRDLAYAELKIQVGRDVLDDPLCYNGIINVRLSKPVGDPIGDHDGP
jgi:hypothetical protein